MEQPELVMKFLTVLGAPLKYRKHSNLKSCDLRPQSASEVPNHIAFDL